MTSDEFKKQLRISLFWEFDFPTLHPDKNRRLFLERIITRGNWNEFLLKINYYTPELIKKEVGNLKDLQKINANFLHLIFKIPKNRFQCYTKKQLNN